MTGALLSPFGAAWRWWRGALASLGRRVSNPDRVGRPQIVEDGEAFTLIPKGAGDPIIIDRASIDQLRRAIRRQGALIAVLPESEVLTLEARLPEIASTSLREAVALQIDELTPFTDDDVLFDLRVSGRDADSGDLIVNLALAPKTRVAQLVDSLKAAGAKVNAVVADVMPDGFETRPRLDPAGLAGGARLAGRVFLVSALLAASGVASLIYLALDRQSDQLADLQGALAREAAAARAAAELDAEIRALRGIRDAPIARRALAEPVVAILDETTRLLPDGSWLTGFRVEGARVSLSGFTDAAAGLLRIFEASDVFEAAAFSSPIAKDARTQRDRFSMTLQLSARDAPQ